ncbi:MAG: hypothetical protein ACXWUL_10660 [Caldimonas sp.]
MGSAIARLFVACALLAAAQAHAQPDRRTPILTCKDAKGRTLITDPSDPRCHKPPPTPDEKAAIEAKREKNIEIYNACKASQRSDQGLLTRYPKQAKHDAARQQALEGVAALMRGSELRMKKLLDDRKRLLEEAEFYPDGKLPPKLKRDLETNGALLEAQKQATAKQQEERAQINSFYDAELQKLKALWTPQGRRPVCVRPSD